MSISTIVRSAVVVACVSALSLYGQTTDTTGTMSKTTAKKSTPRHASAGTNRTRVWNDAARLAAILTDAQNTKITFTSDAWRVTANEANMLANRIYANSGGRSAASDLRTHVRQMRDAALKGDADGARSHASQAMPFATQLIDWSMPKGMSSR